MRVLAKTRKVGRRAKDGRIVPHVSIDPSADDRDGITSRFGDHRDLAPLSTYRDVPTHLNFASFRRIPAGTYVYCNREAELKLLKEWERWG